MTSAISALPSAVGDLAALFDPELPAAPYGATIALELAAVARGDKAIAMYSFPRSAIAHDADYLDLAAVVLAAGLTLTVAKGRGKADEPVEVFVHRDSEAWRVPAYAATAKILGVHPWTDGLEALQGALLGYTDAQIARWIAYQRGRAVRWQRPTVFMILTMKQRDRILDHGARSFPESMTGGLLTWFVSRERLPMRRDAARACAPTHALARFAMSWAGWGQVFGAQATAAATDVLSVEVAASRAPSYNRALESAIEMLSDNGWQ